MPNYPFLLPPPLSEQLFFSFSGDLFVFTTTLLYLYITLCVSALMVL